MTRMVPREYPERKDVVPITCGSARHFRMCMVALGILNGARAGEGTEKNRSRTPAITYYETIRVVGELTQAERVQKKVSDSISALGRALGVRFAADDLARQFIANRFDEQQIAAALSGSEEVVAAIQRLSETRDRSIDTGLVTHPAMVVSSVSHMIAKSVQSLQLPEQNAHALAPSQPVDQISADLLNQHELDLNGYDFLKATQVIRSGAVLHPIYNMNRKIVGLAWGENQTERVDFMNR